MLPLVLFFIGIALGTNTAETFVYVTPYTFWGIGEGLHIDSSLLIALRRYFLGICGSLGIFFLLKKCFCSIGDSFCRLSIVRFVGVNTLGLYLLQIALFTIYMGIRNEFLSNLTCGRDWLAFLLAFFILAFLCICVKAIRKSRLLRLLILGEASHKND